MKQKVKRINARKTCKDEDILPLEPCKDIQSGNEIQENLEGVSKDFDDELNILTNKENSDEKKENPSIASPTESDVLLVGDLVWSKIPGHCWWPSMISYDPNTAVYFQKTNNYAKSSALKFHVQFFGDQPLRGWATKSNIIRFKGKDQFMSISSGVLGIKSKQPTSNAKPSWERATLQAEKALLLERRDRKLLYVFNYDNNLNVIGNKVKSKQVNRSKPKLEKKKLVTIPSVDRRKSARQLLKMETFVSCEGATVTDDHHTLPVMTDSCTTEKIISEIKTLSKDIETQVDSSASPQEAALNEILPPPNSENNSDSGIEDIGESILNLQQDDVMEPLGTKRKRKQKVFEDYHTGNEIASAIKYRFNVGDKSKYSKLFTAVKSSDSSADSVISSIESDVEACTDATDFIKDDLTNNSINKSPVKLSSPKATIKSPIKKPAVHKQPSLKRSKQTVRNNIKSNIVEKAVPIKVSRNNKVDRKSSKLDKENSNTKFKLGGGNNDDEQTMKKKSKKNSAPPNQISEDDNKTFSIETSKLKHDPKDDYCALCEDVKGDLIVCSGDCFNAFHPDCLGLSCKPKSAFTCDECQTGYHTCFCCKKAGELMKCSSVNCGKFYHLDCVKKIPETKYDGKAAGKFFCPYHTCKYCTRHDKSTAALSGHKKLLRCIRCPTAYHQSTCLVAGSTPITPHNMICDKHFEIDPKLKHQTNVNVHWCFVCSVGGSLVCCDTCPASFHPECIDNLDHVPDGNWQCEDCRNQKKPRYGDIVWIKFGVYKWWPGKICLPEEVPERIQNLSHALCQFPVLFFGSKDYAWIHSGRVFKYEEGDKGGDLPAKRLAVHFQKALSEATEAFSDRKKILLLQAEQLDKKKSTKPPPFKKIKCNRPVTCIRTILDQSEWPICECTPGEPCSGESECLNKMLLFECSPKTCPSGDKCHNQRMQKNQYTKCKPFKCEGRGWGLRAEQEIKSGEFVIEYVGELIDEDTCHKRIQHYHDNNVFDYYFLTIDRDNIIDAFPKGNMSRFMNHSCDPNCDTQKWTVNGEVRVGLFANRAISIGDELCFNYNLDCLGNEKKQCKCGSANCSGYLGLQPKTQHSMTLEQKALNKKLKEKEKRKIKREKIKLQKVVHEDECFVCGDGGELILCSRAKCTKSYHVSCLNLDKKPYGKWECPWHYCDSCGKRAKVVCALCPNSYCNSHKEGGVIPIKDDVMVCLDHEEKEYKELLKELENKQVAIADDDVVIEDVPLKRKRKSNSSIMESVESPAKKKKNCSSLQKNEDIINNMDESVETEKQKNNSKTSMERTKNSSSIGKEKVFKKEGKKSSDKNLKNGSPGKKNISSLDVVKKMKNGTVKKNKSEFEEKKNKKSFEKKLTDVKNRNEISGKTKTGVTQNRNQQDPNPPKHVKITDNKLKPTQKKTTPLKPRRNEIVVNSSSKKTITKIIEKNKAKLSKGTISSKVHKAKENIKFNGKKEKGITKKKVNPIAK